jgi:hypothetical protein
MYAKKVAFSFFTVPALGMNHCHDNFIVLSHQAYEFQMRRKADKENEEQRRYLLIFSNSLELPT